MAIVSKLPTRHENHPTEPGEWFDLRPLSARQLREALHNRELVAMATIKAMGGDVYTAIQGMDPEAVKDATKDPLARYDRETLCRYGIVGWSYDDRVKREAIAELDTATEEWAARVILELSQSYTDAERLGNS